MKTKNFLLTMILSMVMVIGLGNLAKGQACPGCPPFVIINNTSCQYHGVTVTAVGCPTCTDTSTILTSGASANYPGQYCTPTCVAAIPEPAIMYVDGSCAGEISWTYLGISHNIDLVHGGSVGDPEDACGNSTVAGSIIGYLPCPTCTSGVAKLVYDGVANPSGSPGGCSLPCAPNCPNFCPNACSCPPYWFVQHFTISCY